jgi:hypothetical protein
VKKLSPWVVLATLALVAAVWLLRYQYFDDGFTRIDRFTGQLETLGDRGWKK